MRKLYLASNNRHKLDEISKMMEAAKLGFDMLPASEIGGMPDVEETGETFAENAMIKARALVEKMPAGAFALADDSGLAVDALDGAPGVRSARYAGEDADDAANNEKLLKALKGLPEERRTASFVCCLALLGNGVQEFFFGECDGKILHGAEGEGGFGYDPLFQPAGYTESFARLGPEVKNRLSHRHAALSQMIRWFREFEG